MTEQKLSLRWGAATDKGNIRDNNQDRYFANGRLFAVADGMGGHVGGEVAAQLTVDLLGRASSAPDLETLVGLANQANVVVCTRAIDQPKLRGMGTTLCAIAIVRPSIDEEPLVLTPAIESVDGIDGGANIEAELAPETPAMLSTPAPSGERIGLVNVGDSRVYMERNNTLLQLTEDHSLVETLVRDGRLTSTEARAHPRRNVLTRAIGVESTLDVDAWEVVVEFGDRFLLCSDGLPTEVEFEDIQAVLARVADPQQAAEELVRVAVDAGGRDNVTCVVVDIVDPNAKVTLPMPGIPGLMVPLDAEVTGATTKRRSTGSATTTRLQGPNTAGAPRNRKMKVGWRIPLIFLAVVLVAAAAVSTLAWNFHRTYYVVIVADKVTVYRGDPAGLLWFKPEIEETSNIDVATLPKDYRADLTAGVEEPSINAVHAYLTAVKTGIADRQKIDSTPRATTTLGTNETTTSQTTTTVATCAAKPTVTIVDPGTAATTSTTALPTSTTTGTNLDGSPITPPSTTTLKPCP